MIPKNPQEKKRWFIALAIGAIVGLVAGAFLPDEYNPVKMIMSKMKGGAQ